MRFYIYIKVRRYYGEKNNRLLPSLLCFRACEHDGSASPPFAGRSQDLNVVITVLRLGRARNRRGSATTSRNQVVWFETVFGGNDSSKSFQIMICSSIYTYVGMRSNITMKEATNGKKDAHASFRQR